MARTAAGPFNAVASVCSTFSASNILTLVASNPNDATAPRRRSTVRRSAGSRCLRHDDAFQPRVYLLEHLQLFDRQIEQRHADTGDVASRVTQAVHQSVLDRVGHRHK